MMWEKALKSYAASFMAYDSVVIGTRLNFHVGTEKHGKIEATSQCNSEEKCLRCRIQLSRVQLAPFY